MLWSNFYLGINMKVKNRTWSYLSGAENIYKYIICSKYFKRTRVYFQGIKKIYATRYFRLTRVYFYESFRFFKETHTFIFTRPLDFSKKHMPSFSSVKIIIIIINPWKWTRVRLKDRGVYNIFIKLLSNFMHALYETILIH